MVRHLNIFPEIWRDDFKKFDCRKYIEAIRFSIFKQRSRNLFLHALHEPYHFIISSTNKAYISQEKIFFLKIHSWEFFLRRHKTNTGTLAYSFRQPISPHQNKLCTMKTKQ